jgi:cytochrome c-type biogenesis protein CcsB
VTAAGFAAFSNNAIMFASVVYVLALLAHIVEWSLGRAVAGEAVADASLARQPVATMKGSGSSGSPESRGAVDRLAAGASAYDPAGDEEVAERRELRIEKLGRIGVGLTVFACLLHVSALVTRGLGSDPVRVPWGNMYEFTMAGSLGVVVIYLLLLRTYQLRWMGMLVTAFEVVVLMLAVLLLYVPAGPLVPALHSYWLMIHVTAAILASGAFAVAAMASALFLAKDRATRRGTLRPGGYLVRLPATSVLDRVAYRVTAFGFPIWTFAALVAGPIWAEYAWGSYWNWDPKEVWAFITWVVYAAYLHARATAGWKGRAAAVIALIGFATLLFNFVGINYFFGGGSMHSYAGK